MKYPFRLALLAAAAFACNSSERQQTVQVAPQDPLWSSYITQHTSGFISKRDKIRIVFGDDVVTEEMVGQSADTIVTVEPAIEGTVTFASTKEIRIVPAADLPQSQAYRVTLRRGNLLGIPEDLSSYEFALQVMPQNFEVGLIGLSPDPENDSSMVLRGDLVTADIADADLVEQVVSASYMGSSMPLEWEHDGDGRHHSFVVNELRRQSREAGVVLAWDGAPIEVESSGQDEAVVPPLDAFTVTRVYGVQEGRQYLLLEFSGNLERRQNFSGLVDLGQVQFTTRVSDNQLRVMPAIPVAGTITVSVHPGIRSATGQLLESGSRHLVTFASDKPGVRFAGRGVILPDNERLTVPFEAINVHSVQVTALRVFESNIGQFLQRNRLDGRAEMERVGRYLWRRTIPLSGLTVNQWTRYNLDLTDLVRENPGGMFQLSLSINRGNSQFNCTEEDNLVPVRAEPPAVSTDDNVQPGFSNWSYAENIYGVGGYNWADRNNPCKDAYYSFSQQARDSRNFLASNIGIVVKRDQTGQTLVVTTDLVSADPEGGVDVTLFNYQNQPLATVTTNSEGMATVALDGVPFYAEAANGDERGYLKLSSGTALPFSHFDVGGTNVTGGIKGHIYGERGVWRPGDDIHLTFVMDNDATGVPQNHPVSMNFFNPQGQLVQTSTNASPTGGFYTFTMKTAEEAPTGNWLARAEVGGSQFTRTVRVETVVPNRLEVQLDWGGAEVLDGDAPVSFNLFGQWLSGANASGLNSDVQVRMRAVPTTFDRYADFLFDDPARDYDAEPQDIFSGPLDVTGHATFSARLGRGRTAPGMLEAALTSRVFERGGGFSTNRTTVRFAPYDRFVGIKVPPGDALRGMLLTDSIHTVQVATLDATGEPVSVPNVELTLYKIEWKWWWDRSGESLAQYASSRSRAVVNSGTISTVDGAGQWDFHVDYPAWGRYLLRACDLPRGHCTGEIFYIDWPGWAGRAREDGGAGANVLSVVADRDSYDVGDIAQIQLPDATRGRALVTVEDGSRILDQQWVEFEVGRTRLELPITSEMSPNVYVDVSLIQPHANRGNDLPIRLYGVVPLTVNDPGTFLHPVIDAPDEWRPESEVSVKVSERDGRRMTYTLAVVDQGLLGLTSYRTPDLHAEFYKKEALGVTTWDLFDDVAGAYTGELERLLALGGSDEAEEIVNEDRSRFPPVVRFMGPFQLDSGDEETHTFTLPQYIGAVRVMVVAGHEGAFGSADKSVFVRDPLSMLATVPRVVGPDEEMTIPVTLFAMDPSISDVNVTIEADDRFEIIGQPDATARFEGAGEQLAFLRVRASSRPGIGRLSFTAEGGGFTTHAEINLEIRSPNPATVNQIRTEIAPGETWTRNIVPHGLPGTNTVNLELTTLPPLNLEGRLQYLIRYPHGCVEQVTSAAFPQLYLPSLMRLDPNRLQSVTDNVQAAIDRLRGFQVPAGAFVYWPGGFAGGTFYGQRNDWATNYVGHFLVEAGRLGYEVPAEVMSDWMNHQKLTAQSWRGTGVEGTLNQAYRLYTLALAGRPEISSMNRLRNSGELSNVASWMLAAAYAAAGQTDAARDLSAGLSTDAAEYAKPGWSLGSRLRDLAIILDAMVTMRDRDAAAPVADRISAELVANKWHSTHSVAFALMSMSRYYGVSDRGGSMSFSTRIGSEPLTPQTSADMVYSRVLDGFPDTGDEIQITNESERTLYVSVVNTGVPASGQEQAISSGLGLLVTYTDAAGDPLNVESLNQGRDFVARVRVTNRTRQDIENIALTHMVPAGWEIHNSRMAGEDQPASSNVEYQDIRDDRVLTYFSLDAGDSEQFSVTLNAAYAGRYYLPAVSVEDMYDVTTSSRTRGKWVTIRREN